jgi:phosphoribosylformimino-5-aminoimidazole carboxamide ribotide isomerase
VRLLPAIDLRGGRTVQLVGGEPGTERVSLPDPAAAARAFLNQGFQELHVVDLDAALGQGSNLALIRELVAEFDVPIQVGGGVRSLETAENLLEAGAARVIVGTRAVEDPAWLAEVTRQLPGKVVVACDVKGINVVSRGWTETTGLHALSFLATLDPLQLAGVLVTDVSREGRLAGINGDLFARLATATPHPLLAAGGVTSLSDLQALDQAGVSGAVLGMSLYTGAIDPSAALRLFRE